MQRVCYLLLLLFSLSAFSQHKLEKSKKELTEAEAVKPTAKPAESSESEGGLLQDIFIDGIYYGVKYVLVGDYENEDQLDNSLTFYPFRESGVGNYTELFDTVAEPPVFRIDLKDKFVYNGNDLFGNHLDVKARITEIVQLRTDYYRLFEYEKATGHREDLSLYFFNFGYDRVRLERFNLGWTLGASYVAKEVNRAGFSYGLNAEYFLLKNISFMAGAKWSRINGQPVNAYEFEARAHRRNFMLTAGMEHLRIASPTYTFIALGGGFYF